MPQVSSDAYLTQFLAATPAAGSKKAEAGSASSKGFDEHLQQARRPQDSARAEPAEDEPPAVEPPASEKTEESQPREPGAAAEPANEEDTGAEKLPAEEETSSESPSQEASDTAEPNPMATAPVEVAEGIPVDTEEEPAEGEPEDDQIEVLAQPVAVEGAMPIVMPTDTSEAVQQAVAGGEEQVPTDVAGASAIDPDAKPQADKSLLAENKLPMEPNQRQPKTFAETGEQGAEAETKPDEMIPSTDAMADDAPAGNGSEPGDTQGGTGQPGAKEAAAPVEVVQGEGTEPAAITDLGRPDSDQSREGRSGEESRVPSDAQPPTAPAGGGSPAAKVEAATGLEKEASGTKAVEAVKSVEAPKVEGGVPVQNSAGASPREASATGQARGTDGAGEVDRARFVQRVSRAFQSLGKEGGTVRLRLSPPELGSLRLEMSVRNGAMTARMEVETQAARNTLLDNLPALRDRLAQQEIRVERFEIDLGREAADGMPRQPGDHPQSGQQSDRQVPQGQAQPSTPVGEVRSAERAAPTGEPSQLNVVI